MRREEDVCLLRYPVMNLTAGQMLETTLREIIIHCRKSPFGCKQECHDEDTFSIDP